MDIYQYINSPEVADFWREKGHIFTAAEAAYIVNLCIRLSFEEKCQVWKTILDCFPDCSFGDFDSVHEFLRRYMEIDPKVELWRDFGTEVEGIICGFAYQQFSASVPFSVGDIVIDITAEDPQPFVLTFLPRPENTDGTWSLHWSGEEAYWDMLCVDGFCVSEGKLRKCVPAYCFDLASWKGEISPQMKIEQQYIRKEINDVERVMALLKLMREQGTPSAP